MRAQRQQTTTHSAKAADAHSRRMKQISAQHISPYQKQRSEAQVCAVTLEDLRDAEIRHLTAVNPKLAETIQRLCAVRTHPDVNLENQVQNAKGQKRSNICSDDLPMPMCCRPLMLLCSVSYPPVQAFSLKTVRTFTSPQKSCVETFANPIRNPMHGLRGLLDT